MGHDLYGVSRIMAKAKRSLASLALALWDPDFRPTASGWSRGGLSLGMPREIRLEPGLPLPIVEYE